MTTGFSSARLDIGSLTARLVLAFVLFPHGAQKMLGWFGGYGFDGTMGFFTSTVHLPYIVGLAVILIEFFAPLLLVLGLATRFCALAIISLMLGIVVTSHLANGFFMNWFGNQPGEGYEYHLLFIGLAVALLVLGPGRYSVDAWLARRRAQLALA
ncbi:DoxX family protein [Hymenobacter sp. BT664]|uniref:DoxX family protein n=1 Tax=Hymenobacter montanus TaxID=2771359 RepID=A0A927BG15_9BACT|nr:DoxX family protein [Hymenobacter montanus]MBD2770212.1 DoxX family protein [Hymenobacter montanus]